MKGKVDQGASGSRVDLECGIVVVKMWRFGSFLRDRRQIVGDFDGSVDVAYKLIACSHTGGAASCLISPAAIAQIEFLMELALGILLI